MNINIRGDKIEVTESIKVYAEEKLDRLNKYFKNTDEITAHVLIRTRNGKETIEVTIPTDKYTLRAEVSNEDLYASIDGVVDVLERQIRKNKTKLIRQRTDATPMIFHFEEMDRQPVEEEPTTGELVKEKDVVSKPMSAEEAVLQMELIGHDFYVFKNANEECVSVVYKRKDGNYGLINVR